MSPSMARVMDSMSITSIESGLLILSEALVAFLVFRVLLYYGKRWYLSRKYTPIPGPTQLPYIGRVHDLPLQYTWLKFKEWADDYGPIYMTSKSIQVASFQGHVERRCRLLWI